MHSLLHLYDFFSFSFFVLSLRNCFVACMLQCPTDNAFGHYIFCSTSFLHALLLLCIIDSFLIIVFKKKKKKRFSGKCQKSIFSSELAEGIIGTQRVVHNTEEEEPHHQHWVYTERLQLLDYMSKFSHRAD